MPFAHFVVEILLVYSRRILTPTCQGPSSILSSIYLILRGAGGCVGGCTLFFFHQACWDCTTDFEKCHDLTRSAPSSTAFFSTASSPFSVVSNFWGN